MNVDLEDRLRRHYAERTAGIPTQGPGLDAATLRTIQRRSTSNRLARVSLAAGAAAAVIVIGVVVFDRSGSHSPVIGDGPHSAPRNTLASPATNLEPVEALPVTDDIVDTPMKVTSPAPLQWYRLQPDLDVAWRDGAVCWRTPVDSDCANDTFPGALPLTVPTAGGQTLVVLRGPSGTTSFDIRLTSGAVVTSPLQFDLQLNWGVARYRLPVGESITEIAVDDETTDDPSQPPGDTLAPNADLVDTPVTVATDAALQYWRWLPDLDVAERETSDGGTELCWRTPVGEGCLDGAVRSPEVGIVPTDGGAILIVRPALIDLAPDEQRPGLPTAIDGPIPDNVVVTLSDGSTSLAIVQYVPASDVRFYARVDLPPGVTVVSATSLWRRT